MRADLFKIQYADIPLHTVSYPITTSAEVGQGERGWSLAPKRTLDHVFPKLYKRQTMYFTVSFQVRFETMESNPLFVHLLPSIERTLEPGYEYWVVIGYDTVCPRV